jgi:hypothetical protein
MLPAALADMFQSSAESRDGSTCRFSQKYLQLFIWMMPECSRKLLAPNIGDHFVWQNFARLMEFILAGIPSQDPVKIKRLKQVMAEYHQIECRGGFGEDFILRKEALEHMTAAETSGKLDPLRINTGLFGSQSRQMGALVVLLRLSNGSTNINFWAS